MFMQMKQQLGRLQCRAPDGRPESTTASLVKGQNWIQGVHFCPQNIVFRKHFKLQSGQRLVVTYQYYL